eukprot:10802354-Heterocapsa_arctica.AAC.1
MPPAAETATRLAHRWAGKQTAEERVSVGDAEVVAQGEIGDIEVMAWALMGRTDVMEKDLGRPVARPLAGGGVT